jgi:nucleoside-diphosphate-sugar epimerase
VNIILTGGTGFLGRKVAHLFSCNNIEVCHLVRKKQAMSDSIVWDFVSPLPALPRADALIHMASAVNDAENFIEDFVGNITISAILADWCHRHDIPLFFTSTASMHGTNHPWGAGTPIDITNYYSGSKLTAECAIQSIHKHATIFRIGGIYGVHGPGHLGLNKAITDAVLHKTPPVLHGSGTGNRNYISVDDAAAWIVATVSSASPCGDIIYLAGKETMPIRQWLETIIDVLLPGSRLECLPGRDAANAVVCASESPVELTSFAEYLRKIATL